MIESIVTKIDLFARNHHTTLSDVLRFANRMITHAGTEASSSDNDTRHAVAEDIVLTDIDTISRPDTTTGMTPRTAASRTSSEDTVSRTPPTHIGTILRSTTDILSSADPTGDIADLAALTLADRHTTSADVVADSITVAVPRTNDSGGLVRPRLHPLYRDS